MLAELTARTFLADQANAGFEKSPGLLDLIAFVLLPPCWLVVLWGHGAYDRRYLGVGTDEFKRVVRAVVDRRGDRLLRRLRHQDRPVPALGRRRAASAACSTC